MRILSKTARWGKVESDAFERSQYIHNTNNPIHSIVVYKIRQITTEKSPSQSVLIFGEKKKAHLLDQYAVGLCLAGYDVKLIFINLPKNRTESWIQEIIAGLQANQIKIASTKMIWFQRVGPALLPLIKDLALEFLPILVAPQWNKIISDEGLGQIQNQIKLIFPLDLPQSDLLHIQHFIELHKIPQENIAPFTSGGLDLCRQETVVLARLIYWLQNKKSTIQSP